MIEITVLTVFMLADFCFLLLPDNYELGYQADTIYSDYSKAFDRLNITMMVDDPYIVKSLFCALYRPVVEYNDVELNPYTLIQNRKIEFIP